MILITVYLFIILILIQNQQLKESHSILTDDLSINLSN